MKSVHAVSNRSMTFPELFQLPATVDLATAAKALGISAATAYKLLGRDEFPCRVLRTGYRYRVPTRALLVALQIEEIPLRADDVVIGTEAVA